MLYIQPNIALYFETVLCWHLWADAHTTTSVYKICEPPTVFHELGMEVMSLGITAEPYFLNCNNNFSWI
jgi:hypothetical protein